MPRIRPPAVGWTGVGWAVGSVGYVSIAMVVLREAGTASGPGTGDRRWVKRGLRREVPYLAGGPARNWHLADSSVGCRGFNGPVPQPTLDKSSSVVRGCYGLAGSRVNDGRDAMRRVTRYRAATGSHREGRVGPGAARRGRHRR